MPPEDAVRQIVAILLSMSPEQRERFMRVYEASPFLRTEVFREAVRVLSAGGGQ
jgi:hypothetical protein